MTNAALFLYLTFTNCAPCTEFHGSTDLVNWYPSFRIQRLDGRTNKWDNLSIIINRKESETKAFWKAIDCEP